MEQFSSSTGVTVGVGVSVGVEVGVGVDSGSVPALLGAGVA